MKEKDWKLSTLEIHNFKSVKNLKISPGRVNVFIGKPNAGKSNLLEALTFLGLDFRHGNIIPKSEIRYTDLASLFYDQNYNDVISVSTNRMACLVVQGDGDTFVLNSTEDPIEVEKMSHFITDSPPVKRPAGGASVHKILFNMDGSFPNNSKILTSNIKHYQFNSSLDTNSVTIDGKNLWTVIQHNSFLKSFSRDFFKEFSLEVLYDTRKNKMDIMKKNEDSYYLIDFSMTPDTFQRMLYYLAVIEGNKNSVILLEEPEAQSYPPYIQMLAEKIVEDKANQYFITTHSPFIVEKMLEHSGKEDNVKFFITYFEDYQTNVHELTAKEIDSVIANGIDLFFNIEAFQK
jgi:AAA15 family ATPase/GTPase